MALKPIEVDSRKIPVDVDDGGNFTADVDGQRYTAPTYKTLIERVRVAVRTSTMGRVEIKASLINENWRNETEGIEDVVLTGIHGGNNNVLYRAERKGAPTEQLRYNECYRRLTADEKAEFKRLIAARKAAQKAVETWKAERQVSPRHLIQAAQDAIVQKATK